MSSFGPCTLRVTVAAAVCSALLALGTPSASAEPATDALGFVDSTARCAAPDTAVAFGSTATSRVAICKTSSGKYEYRGVRMSDGAKLVVPASASSDGGYVGESDGITYTVTSSSLVVSQGNQVIRREPMVYFQGPKTTAAAPGTSAPAAPPPSTATPTATRPLPPPLPAEVGGGKH
ncbi:MAG: hypothetical protein WCD33_09935 [Mycobacterium sp.]|uniref:hypothetical protein n=1 Tax=Mycobacterium sp. TaxID=1785 RepID=UPI003C72DDC9